MRIIVYGAGRNCQNVLNGLSSDDVLCIADQNPEGAKYKGGGILIVPPEAILVYDYDKIIVSVVENFLHIKEFLIQLGVKKEKIMHYTELNLSLTPKNIGTMIADWRKDLTNDTLYDELCSHADDLSELEKEFLVGKHNRSFKWLHYFEIYNRYFNKYIDQEVTIMEIGVNKGGSLQLWKRVLGPKARIIGVDISPSCKQLEEEQIEIYIGNQEDRNFWRKIKQEIPKLDILIDDGGHYMNQQIVTFEEMFSHIKADGVYICEDTFTSYNKDKYQSGYKNPNTYIEYSKNFIDYLHAWFSMDEDLQVNEYTRSMHSVHYYPGVVVIEKRPMYPPFDMEICNNDDEKYAICHFHGKERNI